MKGVWNGMRLMSGYSNGSSKSCAIPKSSGEYADELNSFYNHFDCHDLTVQTTELVNTLADMANGVDTFLQVSEDEVRKEFVRLNPCKTAGPDGVTPRLLKNCASQLSFIYSYIFNWSFSTQYIPKLWKMSCIIPVPKKSPITCNNDL